jgi:hypothetical protein
MEENPTKGARLRDRGERFLTKMAKEAALLQPQFRQVETKTKDRNEEGKRIARSSNHHKI